DQGAPGGGRGDPQGCGESGAEGGRRGGGRGGERRRGCAARAGARRRRRRRRVRPHPHGQADADHGRPRGIYTRVRHSTWLPLLCACVRLAINPVRLMSTCGCGTAGHARACVRACMQATRQIRAMGVTTTIVAVSSDSLPSDVQAFIAAGADDFTPKVHAGPSNPPDQSCFTPE
uniref:Uncharacterized protein n=1 Tax=Aegilops tauschii subsp. strangulata TaxID=200361 RepID=A0A453LS49_AEGTS